MARHSHHCGSPGEVQPQAQNSSALQWHVTSHIGLGCFIQCTHQLHQLLRASCHGQGTTGCSCADHSIAGVRVLSHGPVESFNRTHALLSPIGRCCSPVLVAVPLSSTRLCHRSLLRLVHTCTRRTVISGICGLARIFNHVGFDISNSSSASVISTRCCLSRDHGVKVHRPVLNVLPQSHDNDRCILQSVYREVFIHFDLGG